MTPDRTAWWAEAAEGKRLCEEAKLHYPESIFPLLMEKLIETNERIATLCDALEVL